jgi:hypothetical protein
MQEVVIRRRKNQHYQLVIIAPLALFFSINSFLRHLQGESSYRSLMLAVTLLFSAVIIWMLITAIRHLIKKGPAMIISERGVDDYASVATAGHILWEEITGASIQKFSGTNHLVIHLRNPERYLSAEKTWRRRVTEFAMSKTGSPIAVNLRTIQYSGDELLKQILERVSKPTD